MHILQINKNINNTQISLFGIKIKVKNKQNILQTVQKNYQQKISEIQQKYGKEKIKVGFLVSEQSKWQYQSIYDEFNNSPFFEPVVLITEMIINHKGKKNYYRTMNDCINFFKSKNLNIRLAYNQKTKEYTPAKDLNVDILFYQQPWMLDDSQHPVNVSQYALTCYVSYGFELVTHEAVYTNNFHLMLWQMFVENERLISDYQKYISHPITNCKATGYSKLDEYFNFTLKNQEKPTIIYAPHHSFENGSLNAATFQKNGLKILAFAEKHSQEFNWIFKPHPRFKTAVIKNNIMDEKEIENYYSRWNEIGTIYEGGDYMKIFANNGAMITDCISFLGEYLPSKNPLFHLLTGKTKFNDFAKSFINGYYQIYNFVEFEKEFSEAMINHNDYKKENRLEKIKIIFDEKQKSSSKIIQHITQNLGF